MPSPAVTAQPPLKNSKKSKNKTKEAVEKERARQIALIAMAQDQSSRENEHLAKTLNNPQKQELAQAVMQSEKRVRPAKQQPTSVVRNDSGVSLEYSVDSASYMGGDNSTVGGSTLMGQNFATDGSVMSASTLGSRKPRQSKQQRKETASQLLGKRNDDEDSSALSQQSSADTTMEVVPTDEELFSVGWAKALDPKSGSYYYFTLDRSKIVWDNPLATAPSVDSGAT